MDRLSAAAAWAGDAIITVGTRATAAVATVASTVRTLEGPHSVNGTRSRRAAWVGRWRIVFLSPSAAGLPPAGGPWLCVSASRRVCLFGYRTCGAVRGIGKTGL